MGATTPPTAVVPPLLTLRVFQAGTDIPVKGLFIAFKYAPPPPPKDDEKKSGTEPETKADKVARIVETPRDADLKKLYEQTPAAHRNKFTEARYKRIFDHYKDQLTESAPDPSDQFVLGITDIDGYLEPVYDHSNPWRDRLARLEPDTFKFAIGEQFRALYIRHPSAAFARAVTRALNGAPAGHRGVNFKDADTWGEKGPILHTFKVEKGSGVDGEQFVLHLPNTPETYVPRWTVHPEKDEGGDEKPPSYRWWLYAQMPHEDLPAIREQLESTIDLLGRLKYPATGNQDYPYFVRAIKDRIQQTTDEKYRTLLDLAIHTFHAPFHAAVACFQEHVAKGEAFKPTNWDEAQKQYTWASQVGADVAKGDVAATIPPLEAYGIVGPATLAQIVSWNANKWLKRRDHLVTIGLAHGPLGVKVPDYQVYMLGRAAFAINAWSQLALCFGSCYGVSSGHSFRNLCAEGGHGAIKNSIHKTGLAIDLTGGGLRKTRPLFPVRFEAEFRREKQEVSLEQLEADLAQQQALLDAAIAAREADRKKAEDALTAAKDANVALLANQALVAAPTKKQIQLNQIERAKSEKAIKNATEKLQGVDKAHAKKIETQTKKRDAAQQQLDAYKEAVRNDAFRVRSRWSMRFRLYSQSKANVFSTDPKVKAQTVENIRSAITRWAGLPVATDAEPAPPGVNGEFFAFLRATYLKGVDRADADAWLSSQFHEANEFAIKLLKLPADELIARYFRATVTQWKANFYEYDGGTDIATPHEPSHAEDDFPTAAGAVSWLNLTRLGWGCQMHRISPHRSEARELTYFETDKRKVPPLAFPMMDYLKSELPDFQHDASDLTTALEDITAAKTTAHDIAYDRDTYEINIYEKTGQSKAMEFVTKIVAKYVDAPFVKAWRPVLASFGQPVYTANHSTRVLNPRGAQFSVALNSLSPARKEKIDALRAALAGDRFAKKRFLIVTAGSLLHEEMKDGDILTGAALAAVINASIERLEREAVAKKAEEEKEKETLKKEAEEAKAAAKLAKKGPQAASANASALKPANVAKSAVEPAPKTTAADWSLLVQPIFTFDEPAPAPSPRILFLPEHVIMLPARSDASTLEWWHFQHNSLGDEGEPPPASAPASTKKHGRGPVNPKHWRDFLAECGYSDTVLKVPVEGTLDATAEPVHLGAGYSEGEDSELDSTPWYIGDILDEPPNLDTVDDEKLATLPAPKAS